MRRARGSCRTTDTRAMRRDSSATISNGMHLRSHRELCRVPVARYAAPAGGFNLPWHKKPAASSSSSQSNQIPSSPPPPSSVPPPKPKGGFNLPWHKAAGKPSAGAGGQQPPPPPPPPPSHPLAPSSPDPDSSSASSAYSPSTLRSEVRLQGTRLGSDVFAYKIIGHETQVVSVELAPSEVVRATTGALLTMSPSIEMETKTDGFGVRSLHGFLHINLSKAVTRAITGESFFITDFRNTSPTETGAAVFGSAYPSKILPFILSEHHGELICQRGAFIVGSANTEITTWFTRRFATGFFGGEGFILQRLTGNGLVLLKGGGATIVKTLAAGEELQTIPGSIIAMQSSIGFDVQMVSGIKNVLFGQGLFLSKLTGPGTVWLQGLPFDRVVDNILWRVK